MQFVELPADGRALPGEVAQSARADVRNVVLALLDAEEARRVRVQWDCDGLNLLVAMRDDGHGELHAHDDALRPVVEHVTALDGKFAVTSTPGWGTDILPLDPVGIPLPVAELSDLSDRERDVLRHLASGARNAEIAAELGISAHTVKFHVSNMLKKLGVRNRAELAALLR